MDRIEVEIPKAKTVLGGFHAAETGLGAASTQARRRKNMKLKHKDPPLQGKRRASAGRT
jgi:hypothetical protein